MDPRAPPIITEGAQNQTLPTGGVARLACRAIGDPLPALYWVKDSATLPLHDPRLNILDSGTLEISGTFSMYRHFFYFE